MTASKDPVAVVASSTDSSKNLLGYRIDRERGALRSLDAVDGGSSPSFLAGHPTADLVYLVNETEDSMAVACSIDRETGSLSVENCQPTGGAGACYCRVDATGSYLLVAHYHGGFVSILPIRSDGRLGEPSDIVEHEGSSVDPDRQDQAHPHSIVPGPDNRFAYVPDLGADRVVIYRLDLEAGALRPADPPYVSLHDGAGPRHLAFHPDGNAYLINELDGTLTAFAQDAETGALESIGTVGTLPNEFEGENLCADVHVHPSGRFVYGSNRGHDSIVVGEVDPANGAVTGLGHESVRGEWPRTFTIDPTGTHLFSANMHSDEIVSFAVDIETGLLSSTGQVAEVASPKCVITIPGSKK